MKLIRAEQNQFEFEMRFGEQARMRQLLQRYPLVPAAHHQLSRGKIPKRAENQQLLEEALQSQREENRKQIEALLSEPRRFVKGERGYRATFSRGEIEWLLQVFNDVRIGSWIALGSPDEHPEPKPGISAKTVLHLATMDLAAFFEMSFLTAVHGDFPPGQE
jgi:hypothetical protein